VTGAAGVTALVLVEWTVGWVGAAAWSQSWLVITRGHFRITAWSALVLGIVAALALRAGAEGPHATEAGALAIALVVAAGLYVAVQYAGGDIAGVAVGAGAALAGTGALGTAARLVAGTGLLGGLQLVVGAVLLGAVTNGMMLGHWYLNQPGLKAWALARLTALALVAIAASLVVGLADAGKLSSASTSGAALGIPGFGQSFGPFFYAVWIALIAFTGAVVWMARRCIEIRSIQSATGLYYVAILTAGVAEFLVRYLMVNST
jgi:hypothetical protein